MLRPLAVEVQQSLRSGVAITSYAQAAEELLHNSVDAGASCVAVRVDLDRKKLQVVDNGCGISRDGLENIAERYHTSKCTSVADLETQLQHYGYRGEALASVRNMSYLLDIESRAKVSTSTYTKLFKDGTSEGIKQSRTQRPSAGTTVTVYDLFCTMPVRNKAMKKALELEKIKKNVEAISLIHPKVSFSVKDEETGNKILQTHKSSSVIGAFTHLFGNVKARSLCEVNSGVGKDDVSVQAYLGKEGHSKKNLQFVYINGRLVLKTKIHKLINHCMAKTTVLRKRGFDPSTKWSPGDTTEDVGANRHTERHAVFVVDVKCPLSAYDITFDPRKTLIEFKDWDGIITCVETAVKEFIDREGLATTGDKVDMDSPGIQAIILGSSMSVDSQESQENEAVGERDKARSHGDSSCDEVVVVVQGSAVYGNSITTSDITHVLQSKVVRRSVSTQNVDINNSVNNSLLGNEVCLQGYISAEPTDTNSEARSDKTVCNVNGSGSNNNCCSDNTDMTTAKSNSIEEAEHDECDNVVESNRVSAIKNSLDNGAPCTEVSTILPDDTPPSLVLASGLPYSQSRDSPPQLTVASPPTLVTMDTSNTEGHLDNADNMVMERDFSQNFNNTSHNKRTLKGILRLSPVLGDANEQVIKNQKLDELPTENRENGGNQVSIERVSSSNRQDSERRKEPTQGNQGLTMLDRVRRLQSMKLLGTEKRTTKLSKLQNTKTWLSVLSLLNEGNQASPQLKIDTELITPKERRRVTSLSPKQKSNTSLLSPLLKLRRKYQHLQSKKKSQSPTGSGGGKKKRKKQTGLLLIDNQVPSTSNQKSGEKHKSPSNTTKSSPVASEKTDFVDEDPLSVLSSPPSSRKTVKVTVVEGGDTIQNQYKTGTLEEDSSNASVPSSYKALLSPLQRIRERLLAKAQARKAFAGYGRKSPVDLGKFSSCKKHADVSKHKNSPWKHKTKPDAKTSPGESKDAQDKDHTPSNEEDPAGGKVRQFVESSEDNINQITQDWGEMVLLETDRKANCKRKLVPSPIEDSTIACKLSKWYRSHRGNDEDGTERTASGELTSTQPLGECFSEIFMQKCKQFHLENDNRASRPKASKRLITCSDLENALRSLDHDVGNTSLHSCCNGLFKQVSELEVPVHLTSDRHKKTINCKDAVTKVKTVQLSKRRRFMTSEDFLQSADKFDFEKAMKSVDRPITEKDVEPEVTVSHKTVPESGKALEESLGVADVANSPSSASNVILDAGDITANNVESNARSESSEMLNKPTELTELYSVDENIKNDRDCQTVVTSREDPSTIDRSLVESETMNYDLEYSPIAKDVSRQEIDSIYSTETKEYIVDPKVYNFALPPSDVLHENKPKADSPVVINKGGHSPKHQTTQAFEVGDFTQAFDNVLSESQEVSCDRNDTCDTENYSDNVAAFDRAELHTTPSGVEWDSFDLAGMLEEEESEALLQGTRAKDQDAAIKSPQHGEQSATQKVGETCQMASNPVSKGRHRSWLLPSTAEAFLGEESVRCQSRTGGTSVTCTDSGVEELQAIDKEEQQEGGLVKWRKEPDQTSVAEMLEEWDNPMYKVSTTPVINAELGTEERSVRRIHAFSHPVNFTKDMLTNVKVLNQIDKKFITCLMKSGIIDTEQQEGWDLLVLVDQHAAHERVRLEQFTKDLYEDPESKQLKSSPIDPVLQVSTTESTVRVMEAYLPYFTRIGLGFKVLGRDLVSVRSVPACFVQDRRDGDSEAKKMPDAPFLLRQIQLLIREQVDVLEKTHGANVTLPRILHQLLCARACHGAIKFGDALTLEECKDLIGSLRECQLPFQCAHGRPALIPLLDVSKLNKQSEVTRKPQLGKLRELRSTHNEKG